MQLTLYDDAIENFLTTVSLNSKRYKSYYLLAEIYNIKHQYQVAKGYAKNALEIKNNLTPAFYHLGIAEKNLGNRPAAKDAFEKAKKDRSIRPSANKYLKDIGYYTKDCN